MWRVCVVGLVVAVFGATAVSAAWHTEHDADPTCVFCKLRHEPLAAVAGSLQIDPIGTPDPAIRASATSWIPADPTATAPARAPPPA